MDTAIKMIGALSSAVAKNNDYILAEARLSNCLQSSAGGVSGAAVTPFNDILGNYNTYKSKIEPGGVCATQGAAMFSKIQSVSKSELAKLKASKAEYAALLNTSYGKAFEANVGNSDIIKLYASLEAPQTSGGASGEEGVSGAAGILPTGVDCLVVGNSVEYQPIKAKMEILSCLTLDTPRKFWAAQSTKSITTNDLASATDMRYKFLGYGDWKCTFVSNIHIDHPFLPSCIKHDVAYASLQKFGGAGASSNELDSAWNPRNKYLADTEFLVDLIQDAENWGISIFQCPSAFHSNFVFGIACIIGSAQEGVLTRVYLMHWGVTTINSKWWVSGWDLTNSDKDDVHDNYRFIEVKDTP